MSPVGGSRHYQGAGLGQVGLWGCPSCGADNAGPLEQGCTSCGAGRPAPRPPEPPTPPIPRVSQREPDDPTYTLGTDVLRLWREWDQQYPDATTEMAYTAGYVAGMRAALRAQVAQHRAHQQALPSEMSYTGEGKMTRTIIAALSLFRDQVLVEKPEEVTSGEWLSAAEVDSLIRRLQLETQEVTNA